MWRIAQLCVWWPLRLLLELLSALSLLVLHGLADICMILAAGLLRLSDGAQTIGDRAYGWLCTWYRNMK